MCGVKSCGSCSTSTCTKSCSGSPCSGGGCSSGGCGSPASFFGNSGCPSQTGCPGSASQGSDPTSMILQLVQAILQILTQLMGGGGNTNQQQNQGTGCASQQYPATTINNICNIA